MMLVFAFLIVIVWQSFVKKVPVLLRSLISGRSYVHQPHGLIFKFMKDVFFPAVNDKLFN